MFKKDYCLLISIKFPDKVIRSDYKMDDLMKILGEITPNDLEIIKEWNTRSEYLDVGNIINYDLYSFDDFRNILNHKFSHIFPLPKTFVDEKNCKRLIISYYMLLVL